MTRRTNGAAAGAQRPAVARILVAVKITSATALPAVVKATQLAQAWGAELVLFQALAVPLHGAGQAVSGKNESDVAAAIRDSCVRNLEALATRLRRRGVKVTVCAEWDTPVCEAITRAAHRMHADLIVAEQHTGWRHPAHLLHPTDWELLRSGRIPVLLVRRSGPYRRPVVLAALDPEHSFGKPARLDAQILQAASLLAGGLGGTVHAVYAYVPLPISALSRGTTEQTVQRLKIQAAAAARDKLAACATDVPKSRRHVVARHPADAIVQIAAATRSRIVVMGAVSRSGLKRLLIGSTAERVLDRLPCDLFIVRPKRKLRSAAGARRLTHKNTVRIAAPA